MESYEECRGECHFLKNTMIATTWWIFALFRCFPVSQSCPTPWDPVLIPKVKADPTQPARPRAVSRCDSLQPQLSSVTQSCPTLCDPLDCSTPGLPVHHQPPELTQTHLHWVGDAIQPSHLCQPLLLPPSIFPSVSVFSNGSVLCISWPKYWSFSFRISP